MRGFTGRAALVLAVGVTLLASATYQKQVEVVGEEPGLEPPARLSPTAARKAFECVGVEHRKLQELLRQLDAACCALEEGRLRLEQAAGPEFLTGNFLSQVQEQREKLIDLERKSVQSLAAYARSLTADALPALRTLAPSPPAGWPDKHTLRRTLRFAEREVPVYHVGALRFTEDITPALSLRSVWDRYIALDKESIATARRLVDEAEKEGLDVTVDLTPQRDRLLQILGLELRFAGWLTETLIWFVDHGPVRWTPNENPPAPVPMNDEESMRTVLSGSLTKTRKTP